jgi:iron complex outermembrane receptor protein
MSSLSRKVVLGCSAAAVALLVASAACAQQRTFNLPAQDAVSALPEFARQAGIQVIAPVNQLRGVRTPALHGNLDARAALATLLRGTGLEIASDTGAVIALRRGDPGPQSAGAPEEPAEAVTIEEVVVTAQKRTERLYDVPVPVTAVSAQSLSTTGQTRLQDYFAQVPGLNMSTDNRGAPAMSIRGLTTGAFVAPTVGFTIDDISLGSTVVGPAFSPIPEVDPSELSRVEVLRGPQGTLYGASSIGGLIKYVTVDPTTDRISGRVQAGVVGIHGGGDLGYNVSGAVNAPLGETLAVRASAFYREEPGYIDNLTSGEDDVNERRSEGARLSALWTPNESFSLKLGALYQRTRADGSSLVWVAPGYGDLEQGQLGGLGGNDRRVQAYSAMAKASLGAAELVSLTGYSQSRAVGDFDVTPLLGGLADLYFGVGGIGWFETNRTRKFSQEFRMTLPIGDRIEWLVGAFYTHERVVAHGGWNLVDPTSFAVLDSVIDQVIDQTYKEYAVFTDLTFRITDRFDIQVGGREGRNEQDYRIVTTGPMVPLLLGVPSPSIDEGVSEDNSFTYLVTPRFKITPDVMAYARFASGYRPGGPNASQAPNIPTSYGPDRTNNYEVGLKGSFFDNRLFVDASAYYIKWQDIQLLLTDLDTFLAYTGNGSAAKSQGVELSLEIRPVRGLTISTSGVWSKAELTEDLPGNANVVGQAGDRLPFSSTFSGALSAEQTFPLLGGTGFVGGAWTHVGERQGEFTGSSARQSYDAYDKIDLRAGLRRDGWSATAYVNNLGDVRGELAGGIGSYPAFMFNYIQPRTVGFTLSRDF